MNQYPPEKTFNPQLELAQMLSPALNIRSIDVLRQQCNAATAEACFPILTYAQSLASKVFDRTIIENIHVEINYLNPEQTHIHGVTRIKQKYGIYERSFDAPLEQAIVASTQCALSTIMDANPWLEDGFDYTQTLTEHDSIEARALQSWCLNLDTLGSYGSWFKTRLLERAQWSHPRWLARMYLEDTAKSLAGTLLPHNAIHSRMTLADGLPGEPTRLYSWQVSDPSGTYSSSRTVDWIKEEPTGFLILPSLSEGKEALWTALCTHLARRVAIGQNSTQLSLFMHEHLYAQHLNRHIEHVLLSHETPLTLSTYSPKKNL